MFKKIINWFIKLFRSEKLYEHRFIDEIPDRIYDRVVYLIGHQGYYWQAVMICPCGCKELLYMNLIEDYDPHWKYRVHGELISLSPSVDRIVGCKSHFYLTKGKIHWCQ